MVNETSTGAAKAKSPSVAELQARIAQLEAEKTAKNKLSLKVSEKGGVSVYGLGRFPVTLYKAQMERMLAFGPTIQEFMKVNASSLKEKE